MGPGDAVAAREGIRRADVRRLWRADAVHRGDHGPRGERASERILRRMGEDAKEEIASVATAWDAEGSATARAARVATAWVARRGGRADRPGRGRENFSERDAVEDREERGRACRGQRRRGGTRGSHPRGTRGRGRGVIDARRGVSYSPRPRRPSTPRARSTPGSPPSRAAAVAARSPSRRRGPAIPRRGPAAPGVPARAPPPTTGRRAASRLYTRRAYSRPSDETTS
jgi:hypothetical protein